MPPEDSRNPATEPPQENVPTLSAAVLRITASLDLATVLQEAANSARALTACTLLHHRHRQ